MGTSSEMFGFFSRIHPGWKSLEPFFFEGRQHLLVIGGWDNISRCRGVTSRYAPLCLIELLLKRKLKKKKVLYSLFVLLPLFLLQCRSCAPCLSLYTRRGLICCGIQWWKRKSTLDAAWKLLPVGDLQDGRWSCFVFVTSET